MKEAITPNAPKSPLKRKKGPIRRKKVAIENPTLLNPPAIIMSDDSINYLVRLGLTNQQIAHLFDIHEKTLVLNFGTVISETKGKYKVDKKVANTLIDPKIITKMAADGHTKSAISRYLNISNDVLNTNFLDAFLKGSQKQDEKIHRSRNALLDSNNAAMTIHMSKTVLGENEKVETITTQKHVSRIEVAYVAADSVAEIEIAPERGVDVLVAGVEIVGSRATGGVARPPASEAEFIEVDE